MNDVLNNIFDEESLSAIKNADKICPSPETLSKRKEISYEEVKTAPVNNSVNNINYDQDKVTRLENDNRELKIKVEAQKELIHKIIESQNQMIKEINLMQEKLIKLENRKLDGTIDTNQTNNTEQKPANENKENQKQQTGAGEGLNPDDFSVEDIFYMGNK